MPNNQESKSIAQLMAEADDLSRQINSEVVSDMEETRLLIFKKNLTLFSEYFDLTGYFSDYFNRIRYAQSFNGFLRHKWAT